MNRAVLKAGITTLTKGCTCGFATRPEGCISEELIFRSTAFPCESTTPVFGGPSEIVRQIEPVAGSFSSTRDASEIPSVESERQLSH